MGAGEEGISAMKIGVNLILFSAVLVFVLFNVLWGENIARGFTSDMDKAQTQSMNSYFKEAQTVEGADLPAAGAYSLIEYNINDVGEITFSTVSKDKDEIDEIERINLESIDDKIRWLRTNLYGKCIVKAYSNGEGYDLTVKFMGYTN